VLTRILLGALFQKLELSGYLVVGLLLYFAHDLAKMVFHDHFGQWFQTVVSPSILDGLA
jgi:hypothetical protein